jgi:glycosyltransferase involved in cell wall biosynthesis
VMNSLDETLLPETRGEPSANGFVVSYHGTITPHYGVPLIIEAAAEALPAIPDLEIAIYGHGDALPEVLERATTLGLGERLRITPEFLPQREVLQAVQSASVGVVPNLPTRLNRYALSTKLFEYVVLGVPVVCSDLPTLREHFSDEEVLFFEPGSSHALAEALEEVASDREAALRRARSARIRYESYRWPVSARRYVDALRKLTVR